MDIGEKFLPVGTVCLLQNGTKKVMITGFCIKSPDSGEKVFDYIGCLYPEGIISSDQNLLFDHNQISQIFFKGYMSDEETEFKSNLKELLAKGESTIPTINTDVIDNLDEPEKTGFNSGFSSE